MSVSATAVTAAVAIDANTIVVSSGTGFPTAGGPPLTPGYLCRMDKEFFYAVQQPVSGQIVIRMRGANGTVAQAHGTLAKIEVSSDPTDFALPGAGVGGQALPAFLPVYQTLGVDTTFTAAQVAAWGNQPQNFAIAKASAIAITLVAPSKAQDGATVTFTSLTDATHAITATSLFASAGASSPYTTATVANAKAGGGLMLQAQNGLWNVIASTNWTLS